MKKPVPSPAPPSESEEQANQTQPRRRTNGGPSMSFSGIQLSSSISTQGLGNSGGSSSGSSGGGGGSSTTGGGGSTASGSNPSLPPSASSSLGSLRSLLAGSFVEDFICVSEFAEQHGPVPLLVVPKDGECGFNLNTYVVRIMAANYQKQACDVGEFAEDAQVALSEPTEDAQCYVSSSRRGGSGNGSGGSSRCRLRDWVVRSLADRPTPIDSSRTGAPSDVARHQRAWIRPADMHQLHYTRPDQGHDQL